MKKIKQKIVEYNKIMGKFVDKDGTINFKKKEEEGFSFMQPLSISFDEFEKNLTKLKEINQKIKTIKKIKKENENKEIITEEDFLNNQVSTLGSISIYLYKEEKIKIKNNLKRTIRFLYVV